MKRRSIISAALAASILASMAGTLCADTTSGTAYYNGMYFNWYINGSSTLSIPVSSTPSSSNVSDVTGYGDEIENMYFGSGSFSVDTYSFGGFDEEFPNLHYLRMMYSCEEMGGFYNYPNLQTISIYNNLLESITLDLDGTDYDILPKMIVEGNCNPDLAVNVDLSGFDNTSVTIPASYGSSDNNVFYDFGGSGVIESVTFGEGTEVIRPYAFMDCHDLEGVNIPDGVTLIEYAAFDGCTALNSIDIPASVEEIKYDAFEGSGITTINYEGTVSQWYGIVCKTDYEGDTLVFDNVLFVDGVTVHCSDGDMYIRYDDDGKYRQSPIGWYKDDNGWRYFHENGGYQTGVFVEIDGGIYAFDSDGYMLTGWQRAGDWYYFKSSGKMATGWQKIGGSYYFFDEDGAMQTGWVKDGSKWYYLTSSGKMATGWQKISNKWYYFQASGAMATGWQKISNKWYYFQSSGAMKTGWFKSGSNWYYLDSDGSMLSNCSRKISGKTYNFNASGVCTNP